jgi:hypothetical protein
MQRLGWVGLWFMLGVSAESFTAAHGQTPTAPPRRNFAPPAVQPPTAETLRQIADQTTALRTAVTQLRERQIPDEVLAEVEIHLVAAERINRLDEWYHRDAGRWTLATLEEGLSRARLAEQGTAPWAETPGEWTVRAYRSQVDGSLQPYAVLLPRTYQRGQTHRLDLVLHGRDSALTEAKFIATHRGRAPEDLPGIQLELFGRGNNAYRWSGETDLFEALAAFRAGLPGVLHRDQDPVDPRRLVLRGFSMGGAGTWHIGLHHPGLFCVLGPGAGFTTTRGYVADLPTALPPHVEAGLHIYDAVDWAENAFDVPIVCYSGEKDPQRQAAVNIENALRGFREPLRFTHLVAPGLEHVLPPDWQARAEAGYRQFAGPGREPPARVRFVTYTPAYGTCDWLTVDALQQTLRRALVDGIRDGNHFTLATSNIRRLALVPTQADRPVTVVIDGQTLQAPAVAPAAVPATAVRELVFGTSALDRSLPGTVVVERDEERWRVVSESDQQQRLATRPEKRRGLTGPIDDAFRGPFVVVGPTQAGWSPLTDDWTRATLDQFAKVWERYFRGVLPVRDARQIDLAQPLGKHLVLFGDPQSNPLLAQLLPRLPVEWTAERLVVGGQEYDPRKHLPALIFPNPADPRHYVVINSGHTFAEDDLRGTNALLYPRWGDWAVIRPTPTTDQPLAHEVPAAGLFDEFWQYPGNR